MPVALPAVILIEGLTLAEFAVLSTRVPTLSPVIVPPTFKFPRIPTPPATVNAPVVVEVDAVVFVTVDVVKLPVDAEATAAAAANAEVLASLADADALAAYSDAIVT